jgi:hypothetical protein
MDRSLRLNPPSDIARAVDLLREYDESPEQVLAKIAETKAKFSGIFQREA